MAVQFGNTWWGAAYLGALTHIDHENRLARGRSYARTNRVEDIQISKNVIEAKVHGSRRKPYSVRIVHPPLLPADQKKLAQRLAGRPDLTSAILNLQLPDEVLDLCRELGIQIFPNSWRELKMTCSCPDWAVPCKHIAAVIFLVANEIDKDPLLVFKLRQFDLAAALNKLGVSAPAAESLHPIPDIRKLLARGEPERGLPAFAAETYAAIDLSRIEKIGTAIPEFLAPKPVFYPQGDFNDLVSRHYIRLARETADRATASESHPSPETLARLRKVDYLEVVLAKDLSFRALWLEGPDPSTTTSLDDMSAVIDLLDGLRAEDLVALAPEFSLLRLAREIALQCLRAGAIVPAIYRLPEDALIIRWEACLHIDPVREAISAFQQILREDLVSYSDTKEQIHAFTPPDQAVQLVSLFIHHIATGDGAPMPLGTREAISAFFFHGQPLPYATVADKRTGNAIYQWLSALYALDTDYQPCLWIHDNGTRGFVLDVELASTEADAIPWIPLAVFMESPQYRDVLAGTLKRIAQLGDHFPALREVLWHHGKKKIALKESDVIDMMRHMDTLHALTGVKIILPKSLRHIARPRPSLRISTQPNLGGEGELALDKLLAFEWRIALGDHLVTPEEFQRMAETSARLIRFKDQYILLDAREVQQVLAQVTKTKALSGLDVLRHAVAEEYAGSAVELTPEVADWLHRLRDTPEIPVSDRVLATLRPYQTRGYAWLYKNARLGFGSILADDMGLGKTLQVLALLQKAKEEGWLDKAPALIVAPATLLTNWQNESARFTPELRTMIYHGTRRALPVEPHDIILTTYGLLRADQKELAKIPWPVMVLDEAQQIKNTGASQTRAVWAMSAPVRIAMSGTPVENRLSEYYSISQFANPGYLGTQASFRKDFILPIEKHRDHRRLDAFRNMTAPFLLRRMKTDKSIIRDLPDKIVLNRYTGLTPEQASLYEATTRDILDRIGKADSGIGRKGLVLKLLLQLKQICNHPVNYLKEGPQDAARTGKAEALREILDQVRGEGRKALIFTQYREMGEILLHMLREWGEEAMFLHGGLARKERDAIVNAFQEHHWPSVLVLSIKAGGTGLNLTAATHVVHYDLWWNPAVEAQATDRAFRIGQKHQVTVHRIITRNTLEERIDALMQHKRQLADLTVTSGETWIGELSDQEIRSLVAFTPE